jgi:hypothetical protein
MNKIFYVFLLGLLFVSFGQELCGMQPGQDGGQRQRGHKRKSEAIEAIQPMTVSRKREISEVLQLVLTSARTDLFFCNLLTNSFKDECGRARFAINSIDPQAQEKYYKDRGKRRPECFTFSSADI